MDDAEKAIRIDQAREVLEWVYSDPLHPRPEFEKEIMQFVRGSDCHIPVALIDMVSAWNRDNPDLEIPHE